MGDALRTRRTTFFFRGAPSVAALVGAGFVLGSGAAAFASLRWQDINGDHLQINLNLFFLGGMFNVNLR